MTSMFSFGFSGDDIEDDADAGVTDTTRFYNEQNSPSEKLPELFPAEKHPIDEWTSSLPSQIAYNTLNLSPNPHGEQEQECPRLGRREIFDVRTQLMAEDAPDHDELVAGLEHGDLKPNFYEGGFKTWECALDLARLVTDPSQIHFGDDELHVIELGCGTAVPTLALFAGLLSGPETTALDQKKKGYRFTLADYNSTVLRMVTLPNLLLTWWLNTSTISSSEDARTQKPDEGELDIDSALIDAFQADLAKRGITIDFIFGGWSPRFVDLVLEQQHRHANTASSSRDTLVLASETIYSLSSLGAFSHTLVQLLRDAGKNGKSKALIAAKKVYFGVGGGVDEFLHVLHQQQLAGNEHLNTRESSHVASEGVGRIILEISIDTISTKT